MEISGDHFDYYYYVKIEHTPPSLVPSCSLWSLKLLFKFCVFLHDMSNGQRIGIVPNG